MKSKLSSLVTSSAVTIFLFLDSLPESSSRAILKKISAFDTLDYPINIHFEETFQFIEEMRQKNKNVLVHCHAGISRSVAIVCAYLMKKKSWNFL